MTHGLPFSHAVATGINALEPSADRFPHPEGVSHVLVPILPRGPVPGKQTEHGIGVPSPILSGR